MLQDYVQSQCKHASTRNVTSGDANLTLHMTGITGCGAASSLKVENIEFFRQHHMMLCRDSQSVLRFSRHQLPSLTSFQHERCWYLPNGHWIRHSGQNNRCCVWTLWSSYNMTLYTTGLPNENRQDVVKFSNISGISATDTVQKGWLNQPWLMIENGKPPFLLMLLANANCGCHRALRHNLTGSKWLH